MNRPLDSKDAKENNFIFADTPGVPGYLVYLKYGYRLTRYERREIQRYREVYYFGQKIAKRNKRYRQLMKNNYETEHGYYDYIGPHDHVHYRYEIVQEIGRGGFSTVFEAYDHKLGKSVALKSVIKFIRGKHREINMLNYLKECNCTNSAIEILHYFEFRKFMFIATDLLRCDLYTYYKLYGSIGVGFETLTDIAYSLLKCVCEIHNCEILHCDIKPHNVLLKEVGQPTVKLADFGLSCFFYEMPRYIFVNTLPYKAPELILRGPLSTGVDIWAVGCLLAELYIGTPLFAGENDFDQLALIMGVLGIPPTEVLNQCAPEIVARSFDEQGFPRFCQVVPSPDGTVRIVPRPSLNGYPRFFPGSVPLAKALTGCLPPDPDFVDLIRSCLQWDPIKRISAVEALNHRIFRKRVASTRLNQGVPVYRPADCYEAPKTHHEVMERARSVGHHTCPF